MSSPQGSSSCKVSSDEIVPWFESGVLSPASSEVRSSKPSCWLLELSPYPAILEVDVKSGIEKLEFLSFSSKVQPNMHLENRDSERDH